MFCGSVRKSKMLTSLWLLALTVSSRSKSSSADCSTSPPPSAFALPEASACSDESLALLELLLATVLLVTEAELLGAGLFGAAWAALRGAALASRLMLLLPASPLTLQKKCLCQKLTAEHSAE